MTQARPLCAALLLIAFAAGCGSDSNGGSTSLFGDYQPPGPNSPRGIASDKKAEAHVPTGVAPMEAYAADHQGAYTGATVAELRTIDPSIPTDLGVAAQPSSFTLTVHSLYTGTDFTITKAATGQVVYVCSAPGIGDCPQNRDWRN